MSSLFGSPIPQHRAFPVGIVHNFYIYDVIEDLVEYTDMITVLDTATENDIINIYLNTPGGDVYTAISIIHAIMRTDANVITHADGLVASAGTLIYFAAQTRAINHYSTFMFHDASTGMSGKLNENTKYIQSLTKLIERMTYELYSPYFTKDEIAEILDGKDYYCDSDEMIARLEAGEEVLKKVMEEVRENTEKETVERAQAPKKRSKKKSD